MGSFFHTVSYKPIYNVLISIYNVLPLHDLGIAIIMTTLILRVFLIPLYKKQIDSQKKMQEIQPKIKELNQKYKNDKERQARETMELYKKTGTNPFGGCLPTIIQMFFFFAIYRVIFNISQNGMSASPQDLYAFVSNPGQINHYFLGIIDLSTPVPLKDLLSSNFVSVFGSNFFHILLAFLTGLAQYFQTKMLMAKISSKKTPEATTDKGGQPDFSQVLNSQMLFLLPGLAFFFGINFPAGLSIYWLTGTLFMIGQQIYAQKQKAASAN